MITTNDINGMMAEAGKRFHDSIVKEMVNVFWMNDEELRIYMRKKELEDQLSRAKRYLADAKEKVDSEISSIHYLEVELKKLANGAK